MNTNEEQKKRESDLSGVRMQTGLHGEAAGKKSLIEKEKNTHESANIPTQETNEKKEARIRTNVRGTGRVSTNPN